MSKMSLVEGFLDNSDIFLLVAVALRHDTALGHLEILESLVGVEASVDAPQVTKCIFLALVVQVSFAV
jgi:hypothetical protein